MRSYSTSKVLTSVTVDEIAVNVLVDSVLLDLLWLPALSNNIKMHAVSNFGNIVLFIIGKIQNGNDWVVIAELLISR
jgi:hypothetical protein